MKRINVRGFIVKGRTEQRTGSETDLPKECHKRKKNQNNEVKYHDDKLIAPPVKQAAFKMLSRDEFLQTECESICEGTVFWEADPETVASYVTAGRLSVNELNTEGKSILAVASACGDFDLVKCLVENGANVDFHGKRSDFTPLMEASSYGYNEIVDFLIKKGADINRVTRNNNSALHFACAKGHPKVVRSLISSKADANLPNNDGFTPLIEASSSGCVESARIILDYDQSTLHPRTNVLGDNMFSHIKDTPLTMACYRGNIQLARFLLEYSLKHNSLCKEELYTALLEACLDNHLDIIKLLIDFGAQIHPPDSSFESPLSLAANSGNLELTRLLLDKGANINEENEEGITPLMEAARERHLELVKELISLGANVNIRIQETGETALSMAAAGGSIEIINTLIASGANILDSIDMALLEASTFNHLVVASYLESLGADVNFQSTFNSDTPLSNACENGSYDVADFLIKKGAKLEHVTQEGLTPMMLASKNGHLQVVNLLALAGAEIDTQVDQFSHTSLSLACLHGHFEIASLLIRYGANPYRLYKDNVSLLMQACRGGHLDVVRLLLDPTLAWEGTRCTDLKLNSSYNSYDSQLKSLPSSSSEKNNLDQNTLSHENETPYQTLVASKPSQNATIDEANSFDSATSSDIEFSFKTAEVNPSKHIKTNSNRPNSLLNAQQDLSTSCETEFLKTYPKMVDILMPVHIAQENRKGFIISKSKSSTTERPTRSTLASKVSPCKSPHLLNNNSKSSLMHFQKLQKVNINHVSESNLESALSISCSEGRPEIVSLLLSKGANKDHKDINGFTPLMLAVQTGSLPIVKCLLASGASTEFYSEKNHDTALILACKTKRVDIVKILLDYGAEVNHLNSSEKTPLIIASNYGHLELTQLLLERGSNPNVSVRGPTPLMIAASSGKVDIMRLLIEKGALVQTEKQRTSALTLACANGHKAAVELLLENKAMTDQRNEKGYTPLMEAVKAGNIKIAEALIKGGADVNATSGQSTRDTPLILASETGHHEILCLLLQNKANTESKNKKGQTPIWISAEKGFLNCVEALENYGAKLDAVDNKDVSVLTTALRRGHLEIVKYLACKVMRFPSDNECKKLLNSLPDQIKKSNNRVSECLSVIKEAKAKQEIEAERAASDLIKMEIQEREKKSASSKKREKKKKRKAKSQEAKKEEVVAKPLEAMLEKPVEIQKTLKPTKRDLKQTVEIDSSPENEEDLSDNEEYRLVRRRPSTIKPDSLRRIVKTQIPSHLVSRFIGKNGMFINSLRIKTNTVIDIDTTKKEPHGDCTIIIKGLLADIRTVLSLLTAVIADPECITLATLSDLDYIRQSNDPANHIIVNPSSQNRISYPPSHHGIHHRVLPTPISPISVLENHSVHAHEASKPLFQNSNFYSGVDNRPFDNMSSDSPRPQIGSFHASVHNNLMELNEKSSLFNNSTVPTSKVSYPTTQQQNAVFDLCPGSGRPLPARIEPSEFNKKTWDAIHNGKNKIGVMLDKKVWMETTADVGSESNADIEELNNLMASVPMLNSMEDVIKFLESSKIFDM